MVSSLSYFAQPDFFEKPGGINVRTKDKHLDNVRKFFGWAVQRHEMTHNPLSGMRVQTKAQKATLTRRGFSQPELAALFAPELRAAHAATPSHFWLPVLALHTGARLRELAQLRMVDVHQVEGIWGVDINYHAGPLKNPQSQRFVPLASAVVALGFLDYVNDVRAAGFRGFDGGADRGNHRSSVRQRVGPALHSAQNRGGAIAGKFKLPPLDGYVSGQFADVFTGLRKKRARDAAVVAREGRQGQKVKKVRDDASAGDG